MEIDYATSNITNSDDLREKIHEIHNYMRNNGIGYGLTSLKVFNLFYGLMKIEEYGLNEAIGLNNDKCKFSYLLNLINNPDEKNKFINILNDETLNIIYDTTNTTNNVNLLIGYNIPIDLKPDVYKYLMNEINSIKDIEKSSKEQLSGKIYEYFVGRDQSAISELGAYFTNRRIVDFTLNKIKPQLKPDGTIPKMIDMFGGSGGFTIGYTDYLIKNNIGIDWKTQLDNIYHFDINEDVLKSARLELFCLSKGVFPNMKNNIKRTNSFTYDDFNKKFDLIMTNPPYGGDKIGTSAKKEKRDKIIKYIDNEIDIFKKNIIEIIEKADDIKNKKKILDDIKKPKTNIDKIISLIKDIDIDVNIKRIKELYNQSKSLKKENKTEIENNKKLCVNIDSCSKQINNFAVKHKLTGNDKEACSLMLIMDLLEIDGTAVGVLKEGLFFDSSYKDLRKVLLTEYNVKEIISIPANQFENTSTKTSIVIFNNNEDIKTSYINFSELKVNLYEKDEIIEDINKEGKIEIKLKYNKGDIINVEEVFIKTVSIDEILNNDSISLNYKDYNKVSIIPGEDFELVKIKDICEFQNGYAFKTNEYSSEGIPLITITNINLNNKMVLNETTQKYIIENDKYNKYELFINDLLISLTGKKPNLCKIAIKEDYSKSYLNQRVLLLRKFKLINIYYFLSIFKSYINNYINQTLGNGSNQDNISSEDILNIEIPIPKTPELLKYWENKISTPFMRKQEKERRFKEVEEEIKNKIKDIQENHECEEVKLGDIIDTKSGTYITKDKFIKGKYPVYGGGNITNYINIYNRENELIINKDGLSLNCVKYENGKFFLNHHGWTLIYKQNDFKKFIDYYLLNNKQIIYNIANGSNQKGINKNKFLEFKIKLPKDKSLIDNLQPLFNEVEELQKDIKELDETYNNYLKELSKAAIKNQEILNENIEIIEDTEEVDEKSNVDEETTSTKSSKSQTIQQLKEQCKSLGIKGYSNKKKNELIELIKNHK